MTASTGRCRGGAFTEASSHHRAKALSRENVAGPSYRGPMTLEFTGELWFWRGPAPHHFVTVPADESGVLTAMSAAVTYGWGMIPVRAEIGATGWTTSLFPKDGGYIVPVKARVRQAEGLEVGETVTIRLTVGA